MEACNDSTGVEENKDGQGRYSLAQKRRMLVRSKAITMSDRLANRSSHNVVSGGTSSGSSSSLLQAVPESEIITGDHLHYQSLDASPISSLPDNVLRMLGLLSRFDPQKNLNEPDVEEQFAKLSLAFKTDKYTLSKRLELQQRQRDIAEKNIDAELKSLRESLNALNQLCTDSDMREVITKTQQHVDIVQQTTMRMSSRAETYGAIQQEERMNCAFETMLNYVEHLKLVYDKEHIELEEYRRLLAEHNLLPEEKKTGEATDDSKRVLPPRSHSLSSSSKPEPRSRLLSYVCLLNTSSESKGSQNGAETQSMNPTLSPKSRRASLPVGPMSSSSATQQSSLSSFHAASLVSDFRLMAENGKVTRDETERKISVSESVSVRKDSSSFLSKSEKMKDSESFAPVDSVPSMDSESTVDKDSSSSPVICRRRSDLGNEFTQRMENCIIRDSETDLCDSSSDCKEITISTKPNCLYHFRFLNILTMQKGAVHWDGGTIFLHLRYMMSALLAVAALFSLMMTFLPNGLVTNLSPL